MTVQVESRHTFITVVSTVDDDCTCRQMIMSYHQASLSSRVRMIELEDGKAKIHLGNKPRTIFSFQHAQNSHVQHERTSRYYHAGRSTYVSGSQPNGGTI